MKNVNLTLVFTLLIGVFFSCQAPADQVEALDMDAIKAEIQALEDAYAAADNAKDAEGQVAYYADDAISMPAGEPAVEGKAAILARTKANMAADTTSGGTNAYEVLDVFAAGDLAVETGKWMYTNADGESYTGKYISIFEKRDGKYICVRDIWNRDSKDMDDDDDEEADDDAEDN